MNGDNLNEVELTRELVKINSENPPGNEKEVAKYIYDYLNDLKFSPELVKFGENRYNVIASVGKGNGLMLNDHIDTVPVGNLENWKYDPFSARVVDGKIYGRGSNDSKGGVAAILVAVKGLVKNKFKKKLLLVFDGDEEVGFRGSYFLIDKKKEAFKDVKYGVVADGDMKITIAQRGPLHLKFVFTGKSAHGSMPNAGDNAILKATKFVEEVRRQTKNLTRKRDKLLGTGSINVGKISGGLKVNIVPDYCEVHVDRRLTHGESVNFAMNQFRNILKKTNLKAKIENLGMSREAMRVPENSLIVKTLKQISGLPYTTSPGYAEMELYYRKLNIECVSLGVVNKSLHGVNEFVRISDLKKARIIFEKLIRKWCL